MRFAAAALASLVLGSQPAAAADEAETAYAKFHAAVLAGRLAEVEKYAPNEQRASLAASPAAQKQAQLEFMAKLLPKSYTLIGKTPGAGPDQLTLYASGQGMSLFSGKPETTYGTIKMQREGGEWKVGETSWNNEKPRVAMQAPAPVAKPEAPKPRAVPAAAKVREMAPAAPPASKASAKIVDPCVIKPVMTDEDLRKCR
jgi:hypothetical protein